MDHWSECFLSSLANFYHSLGTLTILNCFSAPLSWKDYQNCFILMWEIPKDRWRWDFSKSPKSNLVYVYATLLRVLCHSNQFLQFPFWFRLLFLNPHWPTTTHPNSRRRLWLFQVLLRERMLKWSSFIERYSFNPILMTLVLWESIYFTTCHFFYLITKKNLSRDGSAYAFIVEREFDLDFYFRIYFSYMSDFNAVVAFPHLEEENG